MLYEVITHALEGALMKDHAISHGHAVAIGMLIESKLSFDRGLITQDDWNRIAALLRNNFV